MSETIPIQVDDQGRPYIEIEEVCGSCGGSGVYQGYAEEPDVANVCWTCKGRGGKKTVIYLFTGERTVKPRIQYVRKNAPGRHMIPYSDFLKGEMP